MSAQRIGIATIRFPDPYAIDYDNNVFDTLNNTVSFQYRILDNIQTLSTKGTDGTDPYGILYVPDLQTDACRDQEKDNIPANATRLSDLPQGKNYALIAVAPWYSAQCTIEYFTSARLSPTKAFLTYLPGRGNAKPPVLNDAAWNLQDGGSWQSSNFFPTYALSSTTGDNIMDQLNQYSGNITDVPYGPQLLQQYNETDYIRLWATVNIDSGSQLPSLWVFLVIVLGILILAVAITSLTMHIMQRKRRNALRERVLNGEVDLEALGVKRLTVSQEILDKLPIYTYMEDPANSVEKASPQTPNPALNSTSPLVDPDTGNKTVPLVRRSSVPTVSTNAASSSWSQSTCAICLDDFEPNETKVRELPCRHIFHPDCIDQFLLRNSSLCPMCKQSVLPKGDCPVKITNMMVRRERHISRMRERSANPTNGAPNVASPSYTRPVSSTPHVRPSIAFGSLGSRIGGAMAGRRIFSAPERTQSRPADIEMANTSNTPPDSSELPTQSHPSDQPPTNASRPTTQDCTPAQNRREWARQRALALLGTRHAPASDVEAEEETRGPAWRRTLRKVFPGFR